MKLQEIFRYEVEYRLRSASTWLYAGILFLVAIWMFLLGAEEGTALPTAPERFAWGYVRPGMFGILVTAALFGGAAVRDFQTGMDPLLFTSPLRKAEYLGGRFLGALAVNAIVLLAIPLGNAASIGLLAYVAQETVGPFRLLAYLQPFLLFLLPNLVLVGAILFTIGMLARQIVPVYLGAIGIFIGYIVVLNYADQIGSPLLASLVDPLGLVTLARETRLWTEAERNTRLIGVPAALVWNRALWLAVAAVVLAVLHRSFRFAHPDGASSTRFARSWQGRWRRHRETVVEANPEPAWPMAVTRVAGSFGMWTRARQTLAVARQSLAEVAASWWFALVLVACVGLTILWGWNVGWTRFDTPVWPVTFLIAETVLSERAVLLFYVLIVLYAGELVWKHREVGVAEIADASPVPDGTALLGRFLVLVVMLVMFLTLSTVGGLLIQAFQGFYNFEPALYLSAFGLNLTKFVLIAALAMATHVVVNHKYLGHMVVAMAIIFPRAAPALDIRHNLLRYGMDPGWTYSDMNGFGPFIGPFVWFNLYWAAWALMLMVIAVALWVRGTEPGLGQRLRAARARFTAGKLLAGAAGTAAALVLGLGGYIFYNTNVLNAYRTADEPPPQAEYEKRYSRYEGAPQPVITNAELRVEMYPEERAVEIRGTYRLVNQTAAAIDSLHLLVVNPQIEARSISFDRNATSALVDEEVGYRIYSLEPALQPGDSLQLSFDVASRPRGFPNSGIPTDVAGNGTYFDRRWLPFIGYQPSFELPNGDARERFGLEPQPPRASAADAGAARSRELWRDAGLVQVNAILGTSADQIAVTPGVLRRSWMENGRRYFHYETERPESFGAAMFSGRFAIVEDRWKDIPLRIFHHPTHTYNLDRMFRGMKAALEYLTTNYGPYPDSHLRIVEVPRYDSFGRAHPNTIAFSEDGFLTRVDGDEFDMAFFGTAHEVAHTWWGGGVRGAFGVLGQGFLSESLANFSAMMVTEATFGLEAARRVYDFQMDRYLSVRAELSRDVPLLEVDDQPWIFYGKGAVAMYLLRDHIGDGPVNRALRRYFEKYNGAVSPPTSLDLYGELRAVTPDSLQYLLTDLFETITLWDVRTDRAVVEPAGSGDYVVTLDVAARKVRSDSVGNEIEVPMDDLVEIGVFASGEGDALGKPLYLQRHRIRSGKQTIRITVPREPVRAGIDPYNKLIDRERDDNIEELDDPIER